MNPVIYDYYTQKCTGKKKASSDGALSCIRSVTSSFAMLRDKKPFEIITPEEHCRHFAAEHPDKIRKSA